MSDNLFVTDYRLQSLLSGNGFIPGKEVSVAASGADTIANFQNILKNEASDRRVTVCVMGDSISYGNYSSVNTQAHGTATNYVGQIARTLQFRYGDGGSGFSPNYIAVDGTTSLKYPTPENAHVEWSGTWTVTKNTGANGFLGNFKCVGAANAEATFRTRGKYVVVYCSSGGSADSFTVTIDGSVKTPISVAAQVGSTPNNFETLYEVGAGEHTVLVKTTLSTPTASLVGVAGFNDTGVVVNNISIPGMNLTDFGTTTTNGAANSWVMAFYGYGGTGTPFTPSLQADALILEYGLNDANVPATVTAACQSMLTPIVFFRQSAGKSAPILLVQSAAGAWVNTSQNRLGFYSQFCSTFKALAQQYNCVYVDLTSDFYNYPQDKANGYYFNDTVNVAGANSNATDLAQAVHMGDLGHLEMSNYVIEALDPSPA